LKSESTSNLGEHEFLRRGELPAGGYQAGCSKTVLDNIFWDGMMMKHGEDGTTEKTD